MTDFPVTIFHNPACGTSRNVVSMVEAAGYRPEVVEYLKAGWTADQLSALFAEAGLTPREAIREKGSPAIVRTPKGAALCRPSEKVFALLEQAPDRFVKEDGQVV